MTRPTPNRNRPGKGSVSRTQNKEESLPPKKVVVQGIELTLTVPDTHDSEWIDYNGYVLQLRSFAQVRTIYFLSEESRRCKPRLSAAAS
jgi:hypothetical protein